MKKKTWMRAQGLELIVNGEIIIEQMEFGSKQNGE